MWILNKIDKPLCRGTDRRASLLLFGIGICDKEQIFVILLHEIFLPGEPFQFGRIIKQLHRQSGIFLNLIQIKPFFLLQLLQFVP